ncbi:MAG TPA: C40 family peptidase [Thermoanaerobaculia bacterium]|nr:C40 family peptidase [Thermoanaerobaculia bacterium]
MIGTWVSSGLVWLLSVTPGGAALTPALIPPPQAGQPETSIVQVVPTGLRSPVQMAMSFLGVPYRMGGSSRKGIDCAGLVRAAYDGLGLTLPRTAAGQFQQGVEISLGELQPGDLIFFRDTYKRGISHVGIYIGEGKFVHAASTKRGVVVTSLSRPYYLSRFAGARRVVETAMAGAVQAGTSAATMVPAEGAALVAR